MSIENANLDVIVEYLKGFDLSKYNGLKLYPHLTIIDAKEFVEVGIDTCYANRKNVRYKPYFDRLKDFALVLSQTN